MICCWIQILSLLESAHTFRSDWASLSLDFRAFFQEVPKQSYDVVWLLFVFKATISNLDLIQ